MEIIEGIYKSPLERGQIKSVQRLIRGVFSKIMKPERETHNPRFF